MAVTAEVSPTASLAGEKVAILGKLSSMSRAQAVKLLASHGANLAGDELTGISLVVLAECHAELCDALDLQNAQHRALAEQVAASRVGFLRESELWQQLGLVEEGAAEEGVRRLYTPALLAGLLDVPVAAIRRWHRQGILRASRQVHRLPYFDFSEVAVARHLAALLHAGCSLRVIDRKLGELRRAMPEVERPLTDASIVVAGRQLIRRRGDDLAEPGGQLLIDFDKPDDAFDDDKALLSVVRDTAIEGDKSHRFSLEELQEQALELEDGGRLREAAECYRSMLFAVGPQADLHFALADLLYRVGELTAARERYYTAIEIDEEFVEARASLGCVLAETGEYELAVAAFRGALEYHPDYADVHFHLADALYQLGQGGAACRHWETFLTSAPESPWAETARHRLEETTMTNDQ